MKNKIQHIPTRYALQKRAMKIIAEIDSIYQDAEEWGLSYKEADPGEVLLKVRKSLVAMLENEKQKGKL